MRLIWQDNLQSALRLDGLRSSHPIEVPVKKADEIGQMFPPPTHPPPRRNETRADDSFDAISYSKGSCVYL